MNEELRDRVVERALRALDVPDHEPGFWSELERRIAAEGSPAAPVMPAVPVGSAGGGTGRSDDGAEPAAWDDPFTDRTHDPSELVVLRRRRALTAPTPRWRQGRILALAAAVVVVAAAGALLISSRDGGDTVDVATDPTATTGAVTATSGSGETTTTPQPSTGPVVGAPAADTAVLAFLDALGEGETEAAMALTGPLSRAYIESLGGDLEGFLLESQEGYGAWLGSPDRSTTEIELGPVAGGAAVTVVVVSGTYTGEGSNGFRVDAIPAVQHADGSWLVEIVAFDPDTGGRVELLSPEPGIDGLGDLAPDGAIIAATEGEGGTFYFSLDDLDVHEAPASERQATYDPPGELPGGSHLLVVAYVSGSTITAAAGVFAVAD